MSQLTIVIPTYARILELQRTVDCIIPQLDAEVSLIIVDNASPMSVEAQLIIPPVPRGGRVSIERNRANVGGNANIARALEICESDWLWILGDDDFPAPNAVTEIRQAIELNSEAIFIKGNFLAPDHRWRETDIICENRAEFLNEASSLGEIIFISSAVVRADKLRESSAICFHYAMSCAPILSAILAGNFDNEKYVFSSLKFLVEPNSHEREETYSLLTLLLGIGLLQDIPTSASTNTALQKCIGRSTRIWRPRHAAKEIIFNGTPKFRRRYLWRVINQRVFCYSTGWIQVEALFATIILAIPTIAIRIACKLRSLGIIRFRYVGNSEGTRM